MERCWITLCSFANVGLQQYMNTILIAGAVITLLSLSQAQHKMSGKNGLNFLTEVSCPYENTFLKIKLL